MEKNTEIFIRATKETAKTLKCGYWLFATEACNPAAPWGSEAHNIAGGQLLTALTELTRLVYDEMRKSGVTEDAARSVIETQVGKGIRHAQR